MKIGFVGLGLMGEPMSLNLLKKSGSSVRVFDFDESKVKLLVDAGAEQGSSVTDLAEQCDVVFSMVPKSEHVQAVYEELLTVAKPGQIFVDMSTIDPEVSIALSKKVAQTGALMLDAPVVKSRPAAFEGTLGIYVGGSVEAFKKIEPLFNCIGNNVIHLGDNGRGLVMKLCHNVLVAEIQNAVNEMLVVANEFDISVDDFATAVSYGGATNFYLTSKLATLKSRDFTAAFSLENMCKDIHCFKDMIKPFNIKLGGVENVQQVYDFAIGEQMGKEDFSATIKAVEKKSKC